MNIITPGKLPALRKMRGTCLHCKCEVECEQREAREVVDRNETDYKIKCPTEGCKDDIWLRFIHENTTH